MPWDCHAEHPVFEQTVSEITAGEKEAVLQAGLGDLCFPFPKLGSLDQSCFICGMRAAQGWHGAAEASVNVILDLGSCIVSRTTGEE